MNFTTGWAFRLVKATEYSGAMGRKVATEILCVVAMASSPWEWRRSPGRNCPPWGSDAKCLRCPATLANLQQPSAAAHVVMREMAVVAMTAREPAFETPMTSQEHSECENNGARSEPPQWEFYTLDDFHSPINVISGCFVSKSPLWIWILKSPNSAIHEHWFACLVDGNSPNYTPSAGHLTTCVLCFHYHLQLLSRI